MFTHADTQKHTGEGRYDVDIVR